MIRTRTPQQRQALTGALILALCLLMLSGGASGAQAKPAQPDPAQPDLAQADFVPGQLIVELKPAQNVKPKDINVKYGTETLECFGKSKEVCLLDVPANSSVKKTKDKMASDPRLSLAEPNYKLEAPEGEAFEGDGRFRARGVSDAEPSPEENGASALNLSEAQEISKGENTTVAVLDTGVQADHPALFPKVTPGKDYVDGDADPADEGNGKDEDEDDEADEMFGHGTHVAGIVHLVAPEAKIMPLRVLDAEGYGDAFHIAEAVAYAEREGADVINLSLGAPNKSQLLWKVIHDAVSDGVMVAAAAGNEGTSAREYPAADSGGRAAADGVVAVSSVDQGEKKSDFANYGIWVDITAPGNDIRSTFPGSLYATWSGTSMSTPFISGQAALIHAVYDSLDPAGVEEKIRCSARPLDETDPDYADMLGAGIANVGASLTPSACADNDRGGRSDRRGRSSVAAQHGR